MSIYRDMPICDLRNLTSPAAVSEIEEIKDIAMLILPKTQDESLQSAFARIPKSDIAVTLYLEPEEELSTLNGVQELGDHNFNANGKTTLIFNGVGIIRNLSPETKGNVIVNGIILIDESLKGSCNLTFPMINGVKKQLHFSDCKVQNSVFSLDYDTIQFLEKDTLIVGVNKVILEEDVTVEQLVEKNLLLLALNKIYCSKKVAPYVKAKQIGSAKVVIGDGKDEDDYGDF